MRNKKTVVKHIDSTWGLEMEKIEVSDYILVVIDKFST